ncbi:MAG TPA: DUF2182 domain-containing protein [Phycisphaerae bacterium]
MLGHTWKYAAHGVHHWMSASQELEYWILMVFAMMLPLVREEMRGVALKSLWARRHRAMAGFLLGYLLPWAVLGIAVMLLRGEPWIRSYGVAAIGFLAAALWQLTPMHASALISCHRTIPLAPTGWRADGDCLRFGFSIGCSCVLSCGFLMIACALTGHGLLAMVGGMALGLLERWSFRPRTGVVFFGALALAGYYGLLFLR